MTEIPLPVTKQIKQTTSDGLGTSGVEKLSAKGVPTRRRCRSKAAARGAKSEAARGRRVREILGIGPAALDLSRQEDSPYVVTCQK